MASPQSTPVSTAATCQRCGAALADQDDGRKFCGRTCKKSAKKARKRSRDSLDVPLRHPFVCGYCRHCGGGYVLPGPAHPDTPARYCSPRCHGRARWQARGGGFCTACRRTISDPADLACGRCWQLAVRGCLSKMRHDTADAAADAAHRRPATADTDTDAYQCALCDGWHHRTVRTQQPPSRLTNLRRVMELLRPFYAQLRARDAAIHDTVARLGLPRAGLARDPEREIQR